jgi:hypothetical protein
METVQLMQFGATINPCDVMEYEMIHESQIEADGPGGGGA